MAESKATFEWFQSKKNNQFYWRLRQEKGKIIADSGVGYYNKADMLDGIDSVKRNAPGAPVIEVEK